MAPKTLPYPEALKPPQKLESRKDDVALEPSGFGGLPFGFWETLRIGLETHCFNRFRAWGLLGLRYGFQAIRFGISARVVEGAINPRPWILNPVTQESEKLVLFQGLGFRVRTLQEATSVFLFRL